MNYRAFSSYARGYSHEKENEGCEDYALSFNDPAGRYCFAVACDGHSDKKCFRSAKGAKFGCEAAKESLILFFEKYFENQMNYKDLSDNSELQLKQSIKQLWNNKVEADLELNPITDKEMAPLDSEVRALYNSGQMVHHIYGATFLATAMAENLFIVMWIGDGEEVCITREGKYYTPLPDDEESEKGSPASLCDDDLFTRKNAFRCIITPEVPYAMILSSDGVGDSVSRVRFMELIYTILTKFNSLEEGQNKLLQGGENQIESSENEAHEEGQNEDGLIDDEVNQNEASQNELNRDQQEYLYKFVTYWAGEKNGKEDDCSYAGFYKLYEEVPEVIFLREDLTKMWNDVIGWYNREIQDKESRKKSHIEKLKKLKEELGKNRNGYHSLTSSSEYFTRMDEIERLKGNIRAIVQNENSVKERTELFLNKYSEYYIRSGEEPPGRDLIQISPTDPGVYEEDGKYEEILQKKRELEEAIKNYLEGQKDDTVGANSEEINTVEVDLGETNSGPENSGETGSADVNFDNPVVTNGEIKKINKKALKQIKEKGKKGRNNSNILFGFIRIKK